MEYKEKISTNYYEKYIGNYVKRFYTSFEKETIFKILKFRVKNKEIDENNFEDVAEFLVGNDDECQWWWDVEDCVIITNELPIIDDERILNINDEKYIDLLKFNPFTKINNLNL